MIKELFSKIGASIKSIPKKAIGFFKYRWAYVIGTIFTWAVPIYMLNEIVALTKDVPAHTKITFVGCLVILVILLALRKKIYGKIIVLPHGVNRGLLLTLYKAVTYGLVLGALWGISSFSGKLYDWWIYCGIAMLIGSFFYIFDEFLLEKRAEKNNNLNNTEV